MKNIAILLAITFLFNGSVNGYYQMSDPYNTNSASHTTVVRHQDGSTTYIQQNGDTGVVRYSDGSVDYYQTR